MATPRVKYIDLVIDEGTMSEQTKELMQVIRPQWSASDIQHMIFTDGISNKLVGCHLAEDKELNDVVLVRVYGKNSELIIDRDAELWALKILEERRLSQPVYARFTNGMAYGFVPGECLNVETVRQEHMASLIAQEMVKYHMINPNDIDTSLSENVSIYTEAALFTKLRHWLDLISETSPRTERQSRFQKEIPSMDTLRSEAALLERELKSLGSPIVFCHNDLLLNNIVYNKRQDRIFFIDFEFAAFNYQAFDIATHFCEYAGVTDINYNMYPDKIYQEKWLQTYLEHWFVANNRLASEVSAKDVERLYVQVNKFSLACHIFCGAWSMFQSSSSTIDFDFIEYSALRFNEYFKLKSQFLALELPDETNSNEVSMSSPNEALTFL